MTSTRFRAKIMKKNLLSLIVVSTMLFAEQSANAIGCLSGGAAGAVAGHYAHHHAVLGAMGGCIAGHELNKHNKAKADAKAQHDATMAPAKHPAQ
jgi:uncharacterized protein YcfJ